MKPLLGVCLIKTLCGVSEPTEGRFGIEISEDGELDGEEQQDGDHHPWSEWEWRKLREKENPYGMTEVEHRGILSGHCSLRPSVGGSAE